MSARPVPILAALLAVLFAPRLARGDDKTACMQEHVRGQEVRLAGHWVEARRLFLACAQSSCPPLVVQDCARWEDELSQHTPSIVVSARQQDGTDLDNVALVIDGTRVRGPLPVVSVPLDPGEHVLRFERSGWAAVERRVILRDGDRERRVDVTFETPAPPATGPARESHAPVAGYVAAGVGAVAAATSISFLVIGKVREHNLATSTCGQAGTCSDSQVNPIRIDYVVSGVA